MAEVERRLCTPETHQAVLQRFVEVIHRRHMPGITDCKCDYCEQLVDYVMAKRRYKRLSSGHWEDGGYGRAGREITPGELNSAKAAFEREKKLHEFLRML